MSSSSLPSSSSRDRRRASGVMPTRKPSPSAAAAGAAASRARSGPRTCARGSARSTRASGCSLSDELERARGQRDREEQVVPLRRRVVDHRGERLAAIDDGVELLARALVAREEEVLRLDLLVVPQRRVLDGGLDGERRCRRRASMRALQLAAERDELLLHLEPLAVEDVRLPLLRLRTRRSRRAVKPGNMGRGVCARAPADCQRGARRSAIVHATGSASRRRRAARGAAAASVGDGRRRGTSGASGSSPRTTSAHSSGSRSGWQPHGAEELRLARGEARPRRGAVGGASRRRRRAARPCRRRRTSASARWRPAACRWSRALDRAGETGARAPPRCRRALGGARRRRRTKRAPAQRRARATALVDVDQRRRGRPWRARDRGGEARRARRRRCTTSSSPGAEPGARQRAVGRAPRRRSAASCHSSSARRATAAARPSSSERAGTVSWVAEPRPRGGALGRRRRGRDGSASHSPHGSTRGTTTRRPSHSPAASPARPPAGDLGAGATPSALPATSTTTSAAGRERRGPLDDARRTVEDRCSTSSGGQPAIISC